MYSPNPTGVTTPAKPRDMTTHTLDQCLSSSHERSLRACSVILVDYIIHKSHLHIFAQIVIVVGIFGNILCIVTLCHKRFRNTSTGFILSQMALLDILQLIGIETFQWMHFAEAVDGFFYNSLTCKLSQFLFYFAGQMTAITLSLLTFERIISVYYPLRCKQLCSRTRVMIGYVVATLAMTVINSHTFIAYRVEKMNNDRNETIVYCDYQPEYEWFEVEVWPFINSFLEVIGPMIILIVGNAMVIAKMWSRNKALGPQISWSSAGNTGSKMAFTTMILISESLLFLLLNLPNEILKIGMIYAAWEQLTPQYSRTLTVALTFMVFVSYAMNFALYMVVGSKFRLAFRDTLRAGYGACGRALGAVTSFVTSRNPGKKQGRHRCRALTKNSDIPLRLSAFSEHHCIHEEDDSMMDTN